MIKHTFICDKCGVKEERENQYFLGEWVELKFQVSTVGISGITRAKLLCRDCAKELNLVIDKRKTQETHNESIGERLIDILTEIAQGGQE